MFGQLFEAGEESCGRLEKDLVLFPDDVGGGFSLGAKGRKHRLLPRVLMSLSKQRAYPSPSSTSSEALKTRL